MSQSYLTTVPHAETIGLAFGSALSGARGQWPLSSIPKPFQTGRQFVPTPQLSCLQDTKHYFLPLAVTTSVKEAQKESGKGFKTEKKENKHTNRRVKKTLEVVGRMHYRTIIPPRIRLLPQKSLIYFCVCVSEEALGREPKALHILGNCCQRTTLLPQSNTFEISLFTEPSR